MAEEQLKQNIIGIIAEGVAQLRGRVSAWGQQRWRGVEDFACRSRRAPLNAGVRIEPLAAAVRTEPLAAALRGVRANRWPRRSPRDRCDQVRAMSRGPCRKHKIEREHGIRPSWCLGEGML